MRERYCTMKMNRVTPQKGSIFFALLFLSAMVTVDANAQSANETYDTTGEAVTFAFKYQKGDSYRILSTVNEDVYVNMVLDHRATIVNRVTTHVTDTDGKGSATHDSTFMTSEDSTGSLTGAKFTWGEEYHSVFQRDAQGVYTIGDEYFMPTVRDVPSFPKKAVAPGESWTADGHEAHDLRKGFNVPTPYKVPFTATYTYLGTLEKEKKKVQQMSYAQSSMTQKKNNQVVSKESSRLHVIQVKYTMNFDTPTPPAGMEYMDYPVAMMGFSDELVYWDAEKGAIDHYKESFRILMETSYGNIFEFRGTAHAEVTDFQRISTKENVNEVQKKVDSMGIENVTVKQSDKGLTLSIENIKFKADSSVLEESEKEKIRQIAKILEAYPSNDILVSGHTALAGTEKVRQRLSEERAKSVADYLIQLGVRDRYHVFTQGFGAKKPIASNATEAGKAKNRRVEITILDR